MWAYSEGWRRFYSKGKRTEKLSAIILGGFGLGKERFERELSVLLLELILSARSGMGLENKFEPDRKPAQTSLFASPISGEVRDISGMRWIVLLCLLVLGTPGLALHRNGSSIKFGQSRQNNYNAGTQGRGTGVKIGGSSRNLSLPIGKSVFFTSTSTTSTTVAPLPPPPPPPEDPSIPTKLHVALVVPHKSFAVREYIKAVSTAVNSITRATKGPILNAFKKRYELDVRMDMKPLTPSPTGSKERKMKPGERRNTEGANQQRQSKTQRKLNGSPRSTACCSRHLATRRGNSDSTAYSTRSFLNGKPWKYKSEIRL
ncbi:hypothetical protein GE061_003459 [Apolygus lucorum]|uniref:Uncharacterized protein n=1 Tax=Apolygus lucorum TaxID=248454 RepID=A0A8S9X4P4_APOLU|nr:hypothetical protein GE061_003459 [Apolygus lucorum]